MRHCWLIKDQEGTIFPLSLCQASASLSMSRTVWPLIECLGQIKILNQQTLDKSKVLLFILRGIHLR